MKEYRVFTWIPQRAYSVARKPRVKVVKLGDGYEQRQPQGINTLLDVYQLTFRGSVNGCGGQDVLAAEQFIKEHGAVDAFLWTPSIDGIERRFVCRSWNLEKDGGLYTLSCTFEQVVA